MAQPTFQLKSAFSRFAPVHTAHLEPLLRVDLRRRKLGRRMTAWREPVKTTRAPATFAAQL
jgi:hypothetical protein